MQINIDLYSLMYNLSWECHTEVLDYASVDLSTVKFSRS